MKDRGLLNFSDENMSQATQNRGQKRTFLKKLVGGEKLRAEAKYGEVHSFLNTGIVTISTNDTLYSSDTNDYTAQKRRNRVLHMDKGINAAKQEPNIDKRLFEEEGLARLLLSLLASGHVEALCNDLRAFDDESEIIKAGAYDRYEKHVDHIRAFMEEVRIPVKPSYDEYITLGELEGALAHYLLFRKGSTFEVGDMDATCRHLARVMREGRPRKKLLAERFEEVLGAPKDNPLTGLRGKMEERRQFLSKKKALR